MAVKYPNAIRMAGGAQTGDDLRDCDEVTEHEKKQIVTDVEALERLSAFGQKRRNRRRRQRERRVRAERARRAEASFFRTHLVIDGGKGTEHESRDRPMTVKGLMSMSF